MNQITVGVLRKAIKGLPDSTVVYLGDDEELNGIHEAYFVQPACKKELETMCSHQEFKRGGLLIS